MPFHDDPLPRIAPWLTCQALVPGEVRDERKERESGRRGTRHLAEPNKQSTVDV